MQVKYTVNYFKLSSDVTKRNVIDASTCSVARLIHIHVRASTQLHLGAAVTRLSIFRTEVSWSIIIGQLSAIGRETRIGIYIIDVTSRHDALFNTYKR